MLVNAAASTGGAYYLDADLPILSTAFQLLVGMCDDSSPAVLRPVKGGLSSNARRDLAPSTYRRMDSAMVAVRTAGHLRAVGASRRLLSAHPLGGAAISETPGGGASYDIPAKSSGTQGCTWRTGGRFSHAHPAYHPR